MPHQLQEISENSGNDTVFFEMCILYLHPSGKRNKKTAVNDMLQPLVSSLVYAGNEPAYQYDVEGINSTVPVEVTVVSTGVHISSEDETTE